MDTKNILTPSIMVVLAVSLLLAPAAGSGGSQNAAASVGGTQKSNAVGVFAWIFDWNPASGMWLKIYNEKLAHPTVPTFIAMNPANGVGANKVSGFVSDISLEHKAGVKVLGYVYTDYANRSLASAENETYYYKTWYNVDGIVYDEMNNHNTTAVMNYYRNLTAYDLSLGLKYSFGNPGDPVPRNMEGIMNTTFAYEGSTIPSESTLKSATYYPTYNKSNFAFVAYNQSSTTAPSVSAINATAKYVSAMWITDGKVYTKSPSNPYDQIPTWADVVFTTLDQNWDTSGAPAKTGFSQSDSQVTFLAENRRTYDQIAGAQIRIVNSSGYSLTYSDPQAVQIRSGDTYTITALNVSGYTFDHWSTGATSQTISGVFGGDRVIAAFYR
ncbi:MAG: spherulation-specific family 4 protein [Nitrososphaera sp.]|jgi:hypothetical protein